MTHRPLTCRVPLPPMVVLLSAALWVAPVPAAQPSAQAQSGQPPAPRPTTDPAPSIAPDDGDRTDGLEAFDGADNGDDRDALDALDGLDAPDLDAGTSPPEPADPSEPRGAGASYRIAGMVGQVNGRAIYAHRVLEPMHEELRALGRRLPRDEFRQRAQRLIYERLAEIVQNALFLGEAERDLSDRERQGLNVVMQRIREELIRHHGRGSAAVADRVLRENTGQGLEETLQSRRQRLLVERYREQKLLPRINVAKRDVERYYRDNHDQFNPPPTRTLRLIRAPGQQAAETIRQRLATGEPFEQVASDEQLNAYRPGDGGLMADAPGDNVFGHEPLNEAMRDLGEGEYAGPIDAGGEQWYLMVQSIDRPEQRSLKEAQLEIERILRLQQLNRLSSEYYNQLLERGSYNAPNQMAEDLIEIAMNRYAAPEDAASQR